jgi:hypothetical protein
MQASLLTKRQPAVRWGTILERSKQKAELVLGFLASKAQNLEHLVLQLFVVDAD